MSATGKGFAVRAALLMAGLCAVAIGLLVFDPFATHLPPPTSPAMSTPTASKPIEGILPPNPWPDIPPFDPSSPTTVEPPGQIRFLITYTGYLPCTRFYGAHHSTWTYLPRVLAMPVGTEFLSEPRTRTLVQAGETVRPTPDALPITLLRQVWAKPGRHEIEIRSSIEEAVVLPSAGKPERRELATSLDRETVRIIVKPGEIVDVPLEVRLHGLRTQLLIVSP